MFKRYLSILTITIILTGGLLIPSYSSAESKVALSFSPNQSEYFTDSTFDLSLVIDTSNQSINALDISIKFPADKLQVVNPATGNSFISFWIAGPSYSNSEGTINLQGGLPNPGIKTSAGIISTVKFRAKAAGRAVVKYQDNSKVLANDGSGTSLPLALNQAVLDIKQTIPNGPIVSSSTHENSGTWYANRFFAATWDAQGSGYSYIVDQLPTTIPDDTVDSTLTTYESTIEKDGVWYFHVKAKHDSTWGATTHFLFRVDTTPPASFTIGLDKNNPSSDDRALASFITTDSLSGIDHYEFRVINLSSNSTEETAFIEATSPYLLPRLTNGRYSLVVRALDNAGNARESSLPFSVGVSLGSFPQSPIITSAWAINIIVISALFLLLILMLIIIRHYLERRRLKHAITQIKVLRDELQRKRQELSTLEGQYQMSMREIEGLPQGSNTGEVLPGHQV